MRHCTLLAVTATVFACSTQAEAGRFFCHHCGCCQNCRKVCRLKCEKKEETTTEYTCECEDFCLPGPSKKCGVKTECDCTGHHRKIIWQPQCGHVHTRTKLVKKEVKKEVPDYKWVVEEYCCVCGHWVKVDRDKDKDKDAKDEKSDEGGSKSGAKTKDGGGSQGGKSKPNQPSPTGGALQGEQDGGDSQIERLPSPPAERQTGSDLPADIYRAYYLNAATDASASLPWVSALLLEEPEEQARPRGLFSGLFGR